MKHKSFFKPILFLVAQAALPVHAATLSVTTFADENGDGAGCSLREAVYATNNNVAFGGCPAGDALAKDKIVLSKGTYTLTKGQISVTDDVKIFGADTYRDEINPLTGKKPNRVRPETIIDAAGGSRIFSSEGALETSLILRDLELRNGHVTGSGGAILSWGSVELDNVVIRNSSALGSGADQGRGGAVYLARAGGGISLSGSMMSGNTASVTGGAVAMNCEFNGDQALHQVGLNSSVLVSNTASIGAGAIAACGNTAISLQTSTIASNVSVAGSGAVDFISSSPVPVGSLTMKSVTGVENSGGPVIRVKNIAALNISNSLLAFNAAGNCLITPLASGSLGTVSGSAVQDSVVSGCQVAGVTWGGDNTEMPAAITRSAELTAFANHGGLVDSYLPLIGSLYVLDKGQILGSCESDDQRGVTRNSGAACDAGAVELRQLTATKDEGVSRDKTNRIAYIDVLFNDTPPEPADPTTPVAQIWQGATVAPVAGAGVTCDWVDDPSTPAKKVLKIDSNGVLGNFTCDYTISVAGVTSGSAQVKVEIRNGKGNAVADHYLRPVGVMEVALDLLANDNDENDGTVAEAGFFVRPDDPLTPSVNESVTLPSYLIYVTQEPSLGHLEGLSSVDCPVKVSTEPNRKCYAAEGLRYVANNSLSPFTDTFKYVFYDKNKQESSEAVVTINTDAPDPDKKAGMFDWVALLGLLIFAGLRRSRTV